MRVPLEEVNQPVRVYTYTWSGKSSSAAFLSSVECGTVGLLNVSEKSSKITTDGLERSRLRSVAVCRRVMI